MWPVVRLANLVSPCGASAGLLALAGGLPPGPEAIRLLARVRPELLDDVQRTELLVGWERCGRWLEAQRVGAVVGAAGPAPADRDDFAREHVRVALLGCGGLARADVDLARALCGPLASARAAMERGELSYCHARALDQETAALEPAMARQVADRVVGGAGGKSPGEFRRAVQRAVIAVDPGGAGGRAEPAGAHRAVVKSAQPDGQAELVLTGPAVAVWTALDVYAAHPAAGTDRTLDQRRFDALVELCQQALDRPGRPANR